MQQTNFEFMTGLADIDGFKNSIEVCVWLGFPPLDTDAHYKTLHKNTPDMKEIFTS